VTNEDELVAEPLTKDKFTDFDVFNCSECGSNKLYQLDRSGGYGCHDCGHEGNERDMPNVKGLKKTDVAAAAKYELDELEAFWNKNHPDSCDMCCYPEAGKDEIILCGFHRGMITMLKKSRETHDEAFGRVIDNSENSGEGDSQ